MPQEHGGQMLRRKLEACCRFEFDHRGTLTGATPRPDRIVCLDCGGPEA